MWEHLNEYNCVFYSRDLNYGSTPVFRRCNSISEPGFTSLYAVTNSTAQAIQAANTTAKFSGPVWSGRLWVDIDSYEVAGEVEARLQRLGLGYVAFDSGGKGAHFGIRREAKPSHLLPLLDKSWVKAHIPEADTSVYTHMHLFRLPGTPHHKTGRLKEFVSHFSGKALNMAEWQKRVEQMAPSLSVSAPQANSDAPSVFESLRVMANSVPTNIGNRHPTILKAVYGLCDLDTPIEVARWWAGEINKMSDEPKEDWELDKLVNSVYEQGL
jgi:hypothetical protein